ncbi:MAG TPA: hypothetical protein VE615_01490 [Gaiellaceae bacterium]|nr:hypothetical protein [Gaiellaceae bacterium]
MSTGSFTTPRPMPSLRLSIVAGSAVIALALPVFLAAGWRLNGWLLAATLWVAGQAFGALLTHLGTKGNLAASGLSGVGMMLRSIAVGVVILVVAASDPWLGLATALTYALAYTAELAISLAVYFGNPPV